MDIHSVQEFIDLIERLESNYTYSIPIGFGAASSALGNIEYTPRFIYRGHSNHKEYKLLPGVLRTKSSGVGSTTTVYSQLELNILNDFISEACRFIKDVPITDIASWLEIAQHFGVPTRLLDFTQNPLVALYFACADMRDVDASVWIINEPTYNKILFQTNYLTLSSESKSNISKIISDEIINAFCSPYNTSYRIQYPWIYKPDYREERMNTQSSIFMIWGAQRTDLTGFMQEENYMLDDDNATNKDKGILCCIRIPAEHKKNILKQLNLCGINKKFIYPGLEGVGRFINAKYSGQPV